MIAISYIASLIATILNFCEPFCKKMKQVLGLYFFANALTGFSYLIVGSISGGMGSFAGAFQIMVNYTFNAKNKKLPYWIIILHAVTLYSITLITLTHWYDLILILTSTAFVLSMAQKKVKIYRLLCVINIALYILYDCIAGAYGNCLMHSVQLCAVLTGVIVRYISSKKQAPSI